MSAKCFVIERIVVIFIAFFLSKLLAQSEEYFPYGSNDYRQLQYYQQNISIVHKLFTEKLYPNLIACDNRAFIVKPRMILSKTIECVKNEARGVLTNSRNDTPALFAMFQEYPHKVYCTYDVQQHYDHKGYIHLVITQSNCAYPPFYELDKEVKQFNYSSRVHKGGSSFYIIAAGHMLKTCSIIDRFNGLYDIYCHHHHHESCLAISVTLDYEFFNAYHELHGLITKSYAPLQYKILDNQLYCSSKSANLSSAAMLDVYASLMHRPLLRQVSKVTNGHWRRTNEHVKNSTTYNASDFFWRFISSGGISDVADTATHLMQQHSSMLFNDTILFNQHYSGFYKLIMMGASHMRYIWDTFAYYHEQAATNLAQLDKKHADSGMGNVDFEETLLLNHYLKRLDDHCDEIVTYKQRNPLQPNRFKRVFVLQFGAWDLSAFPLLRILRDIDALFIPQLLLDIGRGCYQHVSIIYITSPPYPLVCKDIYTFTPFQCEQRRGAFRNNYNINVLNYYVANKLLALQVQHQVKVQIIDMFNIILPRLVFNETVDIMHYMSRNAGNIYFTPGGLVVVNAIARAHHEELVTARG
jgi:hypothetical protein